MCWCYSSNLFAQVLFWIKMSHFVYTSDIYSHSSFFFVILIHVLLTGDSLSGIIFTCIDNSELSYTLCSLMKAYQ